MRIYWSQHGLAVAEDVDPDRPLNEQGRDDVRCLAGRMGGAGVRVGQIGHMGKTRAEQTAVLLAAAMLPGGKPRAHAGLGPQDFPDMLSAKIARRSVDPLIVGQLSYLGRLASLRLLSGSDRPLLAFRPGSVACLKKDTQCQWVLGWMVRSELLPPAGG